MNTEGPIETKPRVVVEYHAPQLKLRRPSFARRVSFVVLSIGGVGALTGGFGLLVPSVSGLSGGDFWRDRLVLAFCLLLATTGVAMAVARKGGLVFGLLVAISCAFNVAAGQDPVGAVTNWHVQHVDFRTIEAGTPGEGRYPIESREYIVQSNGTYIAISTAPGRAD